MKTLKQLAALLLLVPGIVLSQVVAVEDIRLEGLQRVSPGSVFAAMPIRVGDLVDQTTIQDATRSLFATGFFDDIQIDLEQSVLVVIVTERPAITEVNIAGNKALKTEDLLSALRENGIAEGQIFKPATLDGMTLALEREYVGQGHYGARVESVTRELDRNRIAIDITIVEGDKAAIKEINIVGNSRFDDDELLGLFELNTTNWLSWFNDRDKYAREKLEGDIERMESFYLDQGYLQFEVVSSQVSVSPDRQSVFITINISEGDTFTVRDVELLGEMAVPQQELERLILVRSGQLYSQTLIETTKNLMAARLGNDGYTFAEIEDIKEAHDDGTVTVTFFVDPQSRVSVRRVEFRGNTRTADEVLRREMRQLEAAPASAANIELGKVRLDRTGFFRTVEVESTPVPGTEDQVDVLYTVEEQASGSISASVGYAQGTGFVFGVNLQENNFFGTGNAVGIGVNSSTYQTNYQFSFTDPYFTEDGVSAGFSIFFREIDYGEIDVATYTTNAYGLNLNFGYPLSEVASLNYGIGYENLEVETGPFAPLEILSLTNSVQGTQDYDIFRLNSGWRRSTLNRGILPDRGSFNSLNLELSVPGADLEYYKVDYNGQIYFPIAGEFTLRLRANIGYGDGIGDTERLPFFENYYAGGLGTVRGFERFALGPRETYGPDQVADDFDAIGGNFLTTFGADMILPIPFVDYDPSVQLTWFVDVGNVFDTTCQVFDPDLNTPDPDDGEFIPQANCSDFDAGQLRYSTGLGLTWISGFGPLTFSIGQAFNGSPIEEEEFFQFSLGQTF